MDSVQTLRRLCIRFILTLHIFYVTLSPDKIKERVGRLTTTKRRFPPSIPVPNKIVINDGYNLNATDFTLYTILRYNSFLQKSDLVDIRHGDIMGYASLRDTRTFKHSINNLQENGLLENKVDSLPLKGNIQLKLTQVDMSKFFTIMPVKLIYKLSDIGPVGYRLMYYYGKDISPLSFDSNGFSNKWSWKSIHTISSDLKISVPSVIKYTNILEEKGFLSVVRSKTRNIGSYQDTGKLLFHRDNNKYHFVETPLWVAKPI